MQREILKLIILASLVLPGFSAVLTEDLQVVIPTGQPMPQDLCLSQDWKRTLDVSDLNYLLGKEFDLMLRDRVLQDMNRDLKRIQEIQFLDEQLKKNIQTHLEIRGKVLDIRVSIE